ncbi:hypothetical protein VNI00_017023 [Paramarasmius palmivorus]|uniref:Epidermal growth factor receptor-like transmembrane-juxtamembrane segment domain-containing protein n=1 Tax=Paramarasmius palmivorus TaxID=297713 RepID=A0AAW0BA47_9AGAR
MEQIRRRTSDLQTLPLASSHIKVVSRADELAIMIPIVLLILLVAGTLTHAYDNAEPQPAINQIHNINLMRQQRNDFAARPSDMRVAKIPPSRVLPATNEAINWNMQANKLAYEWNPSNAVAERNTGSRIYAMVPMIQDIRLSFERIGQWVISNMEALFRRLTFSSAHVYVEDVEISEMTNNNRSSISFAFLAGVAGGVVGAVFLVALLILAWVLYNRRRHQNQSGSSIDNTDPEPFILQVSDKEPVTTNNIPRGWQLKDRSGRSEVREETDTTDVVAPRGRRYSSPAILIMPAQLQEPAPEGQSPDLCQFRKCIEKSSSRESV